jgi:CRP-like cAMP-binding protein
MEHLRKTYLFATLDDSQLQKVMAMSQKITLSDGETLFEAGVTADRFFLVLEGQVKLYRLSLDGNEKVIELLRPGHTFAEALMFMEQPCYPVSSTAVGDVELLAFENLEFLALLRESVDTCFRLMGDMTMRLHHLIKEIDDLSLQTATGRVAGFLCGKLTELGDGVQSIELDTPKGVLASRLSVKPETFSRILHNFTADGLINVSGAHIDILNPDGLKEKAESIGFCGASISP